MNKIIIGKKRIAVLAAIVGLTLVLLASTYAVAKQSVSSSGALAIANAEAKTYTCLNPRGEASAARVAFTGTLMDAQAFYQKTENAAKLGNVPIAQWTDGLPIVVPTEQAVKEMLTGTSHKAYEAMSVYSKDASSKWAASKDASVFLPLGGQVASMTGERLWTATVEKVAVNAVMAGAKPEYLPAILAMLSGGTVFNSAAQPIGYYQIMSGPYAKEIGMNAGQGAMNSGNPPSMTIGRAYQLAQINLGGAVAGTTNPNVGSLFNRGELCYAEDPEGLPEGWVGMNEDVGYAKTESVIMLCQSGSVALGNFAPSSFRGLNPGTGGIARKLGVEGKPGNYNFLEYIMQWQLMPTLGSGGVPVSGAPGFCGPTGPLQLTMCPNMALSLTMCGMKTKADLYKWLSDRMMMKVSDFQKNGWYDVITNNGTAIEPISKKAYKDLPGDTMVRTAGEAKDQLAIVSIYPGDETCMVFSGGRGIVRSIDAWR